MHRICLVSLLPLLLCALLLCAQQDSAKLASGAEFATVETTADAAVKAGRLDSSRELLTASSPEAAVLLRFRTALIERWTIGRAVVAVHVPEGTAIPSTVLVRAVTAQWSEASQKVPPLAPGISVSTRKLKDGWVTFQLPADVSGQLASGLAASIALTVAEGDSLTIHSHRSGQFMPYLLVRGQGPLLQRP